MESWPVNPVDILVLLVLVISAALAFFRGFVHEVLSVGAWVGAVLVAIYGLPTLGPVFGEFVPDYPWAADVGAAVVLFLVTLLVFSIITTQISKQVQKSALNALDRSLGFLFGLARGVVFLLAGYVALTWLMPPERHPDWMREAKSMPLIERGAATVVALLPEGLRDQEKRLRGETQATKQEAEDLLEAGRTLKNAQDGFERMNNPRPEAPDAPADQTPSYGQGQREDMNRLFESTQ
ncbi:MAG: CvpA family protein [Rhodospirillum sp.]|nr:CvpA family protein [Rhodospirillum sp.]MCF8489528.1 CvpA family protein [Rhodospirillum sp.]MCF8502053.1 CvpA family protein [Rhodospirillum sp.]